MNRTILTCLTSIICLLLTAQTADEFFDRLQSLREGIAREMTFSPENLVNLNGAKETELRFGDQFAGR